MKVLILLVKALLDLSLLIFKLKTIDFGGGTPTGAQGLHLVLHSGISSGGDWRPRWDTGIEPGSAL